MPGDKLVERIGLPPKSLVGLSIVAAAGLAWAYVTTRDLFVFTEARSYGLYLAPIDVLRFFLFPVIDWGNGRLTGIAFHEATGVLCGPAAPCVNGMTAVLTAGAAAAVYLHTLQLLRNVAQSVFVVALWVFSAPMLGAWIWQSARFDVLAVIMAVSAGGFWWWAFGRRSLTARQQVAVVVVSVALLAVAFNAKEIDWVLVGVLPLMAVVRGFGLPGAVRRNLRLTIVPVAYSVFFISYALTHVAAMQVAVPVVDGTLRLLSVGFGLSRSFMYVDQIGRTFDVLQGVATLGYGLFLVAVLCLGTIAVRRVWTTRRSRIVARARMVEGFGVAAYLGTVAIVTLVVGGRATTATSAYYMLLPYWSMLVLGVYALRSAARTLRRSDRVVAVVLALYMLPAVAVYASDFTGGSTYRQLTIASRKMFDIGGSLRQMLAGRAISSVSWLSEGAPPTGFFVLRDSGFGGQSPPGVYPVGSDLWPYLVGGQVRVTPVLHGSASDLRANLAEYASAGEVVVAISSDYRLLLVAYQGEPLFDATGPGT